MNVSYFTLSLGIAASSLLFAASLGASAIPSDYTDLQVVMENAGGTPSQSLAVKPSATSEEAGPSYLASEKQDSAKPGKLQSDEKKREKERKHYRGMLKAGATMVGVGWVGAMIGFFAACAHMLWGGILLGVAAAVAVAGHVLRSIARSHLSAEDIEELDIE